MSIKQICIYLLKLVFCGGIYFLGMILGGVVAAFIKLPPLSAPAGVDMSTVGFYLILATPLIALAPALLARGLGGGFPARTLTLAFLMWITYTVNTQLEASIFTTYAAGLWTAIFSALFPSLLCSAAVAYLFPADGKGGNFTQMIQAFYDQRPSASWAWRLIVAAIAFAPIYFLFGLLVTPFTLDYYRQNLFGLELPTLEQILPILFLRSLLFLLACLPVVILWQHTARSLFLRLSIALYILVGLIYMLISTWLPLSVRFPHALEILADEFVYAGGLVLLLARRNVSEVVSRAA